MATRKAKQPAEQPVETVEQTAEQPVEQTAQQMPSIGRAVHYVLDSGAHRPAVIVDVYSAASVALIATTKISDQVGRFVEVDPCEYDEHASAGSWHWPEYVPPAAPSAADSDTKTDSDATES